MFSLFLYHAQIPIVARNVFLDLGQKTFIFKTTFAVLCVVNTSRSVKLSYYLNQLKVFTQ